MAGQTPDEIAALLTSLTGEQLGKMPHALLYNAREKVPMEQQGLISPYEHRAFAREAVTENLLLAPAIAAGTLAYQPYKMLMGKSRSGPSMDQVLQGFIGIGEGLANRLIPSAYAEQTPNTTGKNNGNR